MRNARPARLLLLGLALLVCGVAADRVVERAEVAPQHARVRTMVVVHGGRVVGVVQHVQLGRRFGPPELPPGAPDAATECGQPQGGLSGLLDWAGCLVRCMRARRDSAPPHAAAHMGAQMEMVRMQLARAAAAAGGDQPAGAAMPGFPGAVQPMPMPMPMPLVRVGGGGAAPGNQPRPRWQWDGNMPMPAAQQEPTDEDMFDSAAAQQLFGAEPAAAAVAAEPEPHAAPWWWSVGHMRRPARGAAAGAAGEEAEAGGCHCKHCGCHHGGKHHHHHSHSHGSEEGSPAQPMHRAMWHDLQQQHEQRIMEQQRVHRAARHGNKLLPGVGTPVELIARERAQGVYARAWSELQAAHQHPAHGSMNWHLWDASGRLNWGLAAFVALAVACAGVWSAMLAQCALYRSARANNNAAEVLAVQYYHHMPSDDELEGKSDGGKDADLKPLLREGPVKGAIAAVHDGKL